MKIKLITGATAYEASINVLRNIRPDDIDIQNLVVVPDSFSMQAESLIFDVLKIKSTLNTEVVGISRLASKLLRNENIGFQRITKLEEIFNIYKVVKSCEKDFVYFHEWGVDFCIKILQIIKQFKACKIKPEQIRNVGDDLLDRKMKDLKLVYESYENTLGDKLDLSKLLEFFLDKAENGINLSKTNLYFINFDSFSTEINSFVCKLAKFVNEIYIGFSRPISLGNAYIYEDDIFKKTTMLAKECGVNVEVETFPTAISGNNLKLVKNLFSFEIEEGKSDYFYNIVAKNRLDEIEFVAKYIKHQTYFGKNYRDFAVAVANADYYDDIKTIFGNFGISCYCDEAVDLTKTILGRFLLKLVQIAKLGVRKESLKFLASSAILNFSDKEEILKNIDYFNIEDAQEMLTRYPQFETILSFLNQLKVCDCASKFSVVLKSVMEEVMQNYQTILKNLDAEHYFKKESENAQSAELILKVLDKLAELGTDDKLTIVDFENLLMLSFKSVKVETIPTYIDAVYVGDATESYFADVDTLFVLGATAGALPKTQNDTGIIDDEDIKKLRLDFALEPEIKVLNRRNRLKLFEALQHAKRKLIVCQPSSEGNQTTQKAGFVNDLSKMFGNNVIHTVSLEDLNLPSLSKEGILDKLLFYIGNEQNLLSVYEYLNFNKKIPPYFRGVISSLIDDEKLKENKFEIENEVLNDAFFKKNNVSASQLETYFACPFKHLVSYGLKIKQPETIEPNKRLFGIFEHALLKGFIEKHEFDISKLTDKDIDVFLSKNVLEIAKQVYDEKILKRKFFINYLKNESKIILKNAVYEQKNSNFRPILLEKRVSTKLGDSNLVGFIDRVDKCGDCFRIVDYKTGDTDTIRKELFYGTKLQLFLYGKIIKEQTKLRPAGVYYFDCQTKYTKQNQKHILFNGITQKDNEIVENTDTRLWQDDFKSDLIGMSRKKNVKNGEFAFKNGQSAENFEQMFDYVGKVTEGALGEIKDGNVLPKPVKDACMFCPYISICKYNSQNGVRTQQTIRDDDF